MGVLPMQHVTAHARLRLFRVIFLALSCLRIACILRRRRKLSKSHSKPAVHTSSIPSAMTCSMVGVIT